MKKRSFVLLEVHRHIDAYLIRRTDRLFLPPASAATYLRTSLSNQSQRRNCWTFRLRQKLKLTSRLKQLYLISSTLAISLQTETFFAPTGSNCRQDPQIPHGVRRGHILFSTMHSYFSRLNQGSSTLFPFVAALLALTAFSSFIFTSSPKGDIEIASVKMYVAVLSPSNARMLNDCLFAFF